MRHIFVLALATFGIFNYTSKAQVVIEEIDVQSIFAEHNIDGCFMLHDLKNDQYLEYNSARLDSPFLPASTYKILNALIALETEVIQDEEEVIKWDGVERRVKSWNQDMTLRKGMGYSALWFYQELARRIGEKRMQAFVDSVNYGNRNISGGIDQFWLTGGLRITPRQQLELIEKLIRYELPFSQKNMDIVKDIMIVDKTEDYIMHAKTGWADQPDPDTGWFVGYVENGDNIYSFVINIDIEKDEDAKKRIEITREILKKAGII